MKGIGLALGAGSIRGLAHIGVLKVLEREKIPISHISGSSIGSVIGAAYCAGLSSFQIEDIVLKTNFTDLLDFTIPKSGLLAGRKIESLMNHLTWGRTFSELRIPLCVVATDINSGEKVLLQKGNVARAIRASIAIPPFFTPVLIRNHTLVDGGLIDPIPVQVVKGMGATSVIAVDISDLVAVRYASNEMGRTSFFHSFYESFVQTEYDLAIEIFRNKHIRFLPLFAKKLIISFVSRFLNPKKLIRTLAGREPPEIVTTMLQQLIILTNQLAQEKLKDPCVNLVIKPGFQDISFMDVHKARDIILRGERATVRLLPKIKRLI